MKPQITITNKEIRIITDQFTLNLEMTQQIDQKVITPPLKSEVKLKPVKPTPVPVSKLNNSDPKKTTLKKGKAITQKIRICKKCGHEFQPRGNRQSYCSEACGLKPKPAREKLKHYKTLDPKEKEALEMEANGGKKKL